MVFFNFISFLFHVSSSTKSIESFNLKLLPSSITTTTTQYLKIDLSKNHFSDSISIYLSICTSLFFMYTNNFISLDLWHNMVALLQPRHNKLNNNIFLWSDWNDRITQRYQIDTRGKSQRSWIFQIRSSHVAVNPNLNPHFHISSNVHKHSWSNNHNFISLDLWHNIVALLQPKHNKLNNHRLYHRVQHGLEKVATAIMEIRVMEM